MTYEIDYVEQIDFDFKVFYDNIVDVGSTGTGKTERAKRQLEALHDLPYWIWDYSDKFEKYGTLVHEVKDLKYGQYVIQPNDKGLENYQRFLLKIHNEAQAGISNDMLLVHDELHQYLTKQSVLKELYQVVLSDRNKGIHNIFISTEPSIIPNWILNNTAHVFAYRLGNKSSIEWMRDYIGVEAWLLLPQDLRYELKEEPELPEFSFIYRDKRKSKAQVCIKK